MSTNKPKHPGKSHTAESPTKLCCFPSASQNRTIASHKKLPAFSRFASSRSSNTANLQNKTRNPYCPYVLLQPLDALQNSEDSIHLDCLGEGVDDCAHDLAESASGCIVASVDPKTDIQDPSVRGKAIRFESSLVDGISVHVGSSTDQLEPSSTHLLSDGVLQKVDTMAHS
ncbi:hypothetical protein Nepgr_017985 [Nepenthes gracilis]|uniref:Uncharacterized protein n=1 Tax=Nepenthes gracilis TaxID=150966 RepID=A0AAD3SSQ8_NEPGR|nr:hypothetical protein Nepgr_017985 [Nepenthes gracilis]